MTDGSFEMIALDLSIFKMRGSKSRGRRISKGVKVATYTGMCDRYSTLGHLHVIFFEPTRTHVLPTYDIFTVMSPKGGFHSRRCVPIERQNSFNQNCHTPYYSLFRAPSSFQKIRRVRFYRRCRYWRLELGRMSLSNVLKRRKSSGREFLFANRQIGNYRPVTPS
jgi:hypothetical protein